MKLAFESRIEYLTHCLTFHETRMKEVWSQLTSDTYVEKDEYTKLLARYCEHKRQAKWFKRKLAKPFRGTTTGRISANVQKEPEKDKSELKEVELTTPTPAVQEPSPAHKPAVGWFKSLWSRIKGEK